MEIVELQAGENKARIAVHIGNTLFFLGKKENILHFPIQVEDYALTKALYGNPFLYPFANRLQEDAFYFNKTKYTLDLQNLDLMRDANGLLLHGLLLKSPHWKTIEVTQEKDRSFHRAELDYGKHPELLRNFPFPHKIIMSHILYTDRLEIEVKIHNYGAETMPLSFGFHPYFSYQDIPRDEVKINIPARQYHSLSSKLLPEGSLFPIEKKWKSNIFFTLKGQMLDDVFTDLITEKPEFMMQAGDKEVKVAFGPKYRVAVVYAPLVKEKNFVCFEPMTAPTNGINLYHEGKIKDLMQVKPGHSWKESFWIYFK
ncbi:MAG: aldose 1-epimerase [Leptospiraceae bacterium]|nr:aldose 1-epimerase [Leptospiraceae bacterium]MCP5503056.1 aldose 1-epimerase [Leptospiraceae bacterium]